MGLRGGIVLNLRKDFDFVLDFNIFFSIFFGIFFGMVKEFLMGLLIVLVLFGFGFMGGEFLKLWMIGEIDVFLSLFLWFIDEGFWGYLGV